MKKFTINCNFEGGQVGPFEIFIGSPEASHHPLHFQNEWLGKERGGSIPGEVMNAIAQLQTLANKNNVPLEDLCAYTIGSALEKEERL